MSDPREQEVKRCAICSRMQPCPKHGRTPVTPEDFAELHAEVAEALDAMAPDPLVAPVVGGTPEDEDDGRFPALQGRCPACGNHTLFRGSKGYITCSWMTCSNPGAVNDLLAEAATKRDDAPVVGGTPEQLRWEAAAARSAATFVTHYAKAYCRHTEAVSECPHCNLNFLASYATRAADYFDAALVPRPEPRELEPPSSERTMKLARSFATEFLTGHYRPLREDEQKQFDQLVTVMLAFAAFVAVRPASAPSLEQCEICAKDGVKDSPAVICAWHYQKAIERLVEVEDAASAPANQKIICLCDAERGVVCRYHYDLQTAASAPSRPLEALIMRWRDDCATARKSDDVDAAARAYVFETCADELQERLRVLVPGGDPQEP